MTSFSLDISTVDSSTGKTWCELIEQAKQDNLPCFVIGVEKISTDEILLYQSLSMPSFEDLKKRKIEVYSTHPDIKKEEKKEEDIKDKDIVTFTPFLGSKDLQNEVYKDLNLTFLQLGIAGCTFYEDEEDKEKVASIQYLMSLALKSKGLEEGSRWMLSAASNGDEDAEAWILNNSSP